MNTDRLFKLFFSGTEEDDADKIELISVNDLFSNFHYGDTFLLLNKN